MLTRESNVDDLIEALEVRFLANPDVNLSFGLLTDFQDADQQNLPQDEPLLQVARRGIEELNQKYATVPAEAGVGSADTAASSWVGRMLPSFYFIVLAAGIHRSDCGWDMNESAENLLN